jgi:hypothetical protein
VLSLVTSALVGIATFVGALVLLGVFAFLQGRWAREPDR